MPRNGEPRNNSVELMRRAFLVAPRCAAFIAETEQRNAELWYLSWQNMVGGVAELVSKLDITGDTDSRKESWHKSNLDNRWFENLLLHCGDIDGETTMASPSRRFKAFSWARRALQPGLLLFRAS
jgi:hypothetical protein